MPDDFYARIARTANEQGIRFVLDSSGPGLAHGLAGGGVFLVKPSIGELRALTGRDLDENEAIVEAASAIVMRGEAQHVAVTMGRDGALLVNASSTLRLSALPVNALSTTGAGDSFLAAMVYALAARKPVLEAFQFGMAAGAAAVLNPGTGLAHVEDILRLRSAASAFRKGRAAPSPL